MDDIQDFCRRWRIIEFSLSGSVLRDDFQSDSDIDVLVTFEPGYRKTLFDLVHTRDQLKEILGRDIDLVPQGCLENPYRRRVTLRSK